LRAPVLTDVSIDWHGLPVDDVFPKKLPDLFTGKPLVVSGRYTAASDGSIFIHGKRAGEDFTREVPVHLNSSASADTTLSSFWARQKIDDLMSQDWADLQAGTVKPDVQREITQLGLSYRLMTQFTSFVAVEERVVTTNGKPQRVEVPVEMPEGMSYEGVFGNEVGNLRLNGSNFAAVGGAMGAQKMTRMVAPRVMMPSAGTGSGSAQGIGSGSGAGQGPALYANAAVLAPAPPPPQAPAAKLAASTIAAKSPDEDVAYIVTDKEIAALKGARTSPEIALASPTHEAQPSTERALLESKLSPGVVSRFDCWKKQAGDCKTAPGGVIDVQLFLTEEPLGIVEKLKALGLQVLRVRSKEKVVTGRIPLDKLTEIAKLEIVKFVSPPR
jgi:hypothetical protein